MTLAAERIGAATRSLRWRLVAVAVLSVASVLAVSAVVLVVQQRSRLLEGVDDSLRIRADDVVAGLAAGGDELVVADLEDQAVQVVALGGDVLAASANLRGADPIGPVPSAGGEITATSDDVPIEDDDYRVLSRRVETGGGGEVVVHIAENIDDVSDSTRILAISLSVTFPLVVAFLGVGTWWLTGRTLRPVAEAARRQDRFVGDASHELRSPLARIRARLEVDLAHPGAADPTETAEAVLADTIGMQALVDDLLHLARSEPGPPSHPALVGLDEIVRDEVDAARAVRTQVRFDLSELSAATVRGAPRQLVRAVRNVLDNAVRHAEDRVKISLAEDGQRVRLDIVDDGPGVPEDRREAVFERFVRLDEARASGGGAGLGLAIAREIVEAHGGRITIGDAATGGASVVIDLPAADSATRT